MIIKTYTEPTDVFICGIDFINQPETFGITDDYCMLAVQFSDNKEYLDTCGYVYILSRNEIIKIKDHLDQDNGQNWLLLKDYLGDIKIYFEDKIGIYPIDNIDVESYLSDIMPGGEWVDPVLRVNCKNPGISLGYKSLLAELIK